MTMDWGNTQRKGLRDATRFFAALEQHYRGKHQKTQIKLTAFSVFGRNQTPSVIKLEETFCHIAQYARRKCTEQDTARQNHLSETHHLTFFSLKLLLIEDVSA